MVGDDKARRAGSEAGSLKNKRVASSSLYLIDHLFSLLFLIGLVGADEAAAMAATAECWWLRVPIRWWWSSSYPTAAATSLHVSTHRPPPPASGVYGVRPPLAHDAVLHGPTHDVRTSSHGHAN